MFVIRMVISCTIVSGVDSIIMSLLSLPFAKLFLTGKLTVDFFVLVFAHDLNVSINIEVTHSVETKHFKHMYHP